MRTWVHNAISVTNNLANMTEINQIPDGPALLHDLICPKPLIGDGDCKTVQFQGISECCTENCYKVTEAYLDSSFTQTQEGKVCFECKKSIFQLFSMEYAGDPISDQSLSKFYSMTTIDMKPNMSFIIENLEEFVKSPVPIGNVLKCMVTRHRRGLSGGMFPTFTFQLDESNGNWKNLKLMTARRRKKSKVPNILISLDPSNVFRGGDSIVGELHGNLLGSKFTLSEGDRKEKVNCDCDAVCANPNSQTLSTREELTSVSILRNKTVKYGPRVMKIQLPVMENEMKRMELRRNYGMEHDLAKCKNGLSHGVVELENKRPEFCQFTERYMLNFQGRVSKSSLKNFQIIHPKCEKYIILQFGRVSEEDFSLDFRFPLCPLQAFGIAVSALSTPNWEFVK